MKPYLRSSLSALILLGGCAAVGPDYAPPSASAPASFGAMPAGIDGGGVEIEWWRGFDEPDLESLIQRALAANLDIALAGARLDEAKALLRENREEFLPRGGRRSITRPGGAARWKHRPASSATSRPIAARWMLPGKSTCSAGCGARWRPPRRRRARARPCCATCRRASRLRLP